MRTAQHIFRSLTAALAATASLLLCLAVSCRRAPAPLPDDFGVTVLIDNPSSSDGTKAIADNEINSIAIFAFSGSELVGYVYESELTGKTTFPMTLKASGAIDFYAIANPDPGYFSIVDAGGQPIDLSTSDANPSEYEATGISNWRVEINDDASSIPGEADPWYAPMSNLSGAGGTNRRYTIDPDDNWTVIPLELTRAVSKIEVWFRAKNEVELEYWQEYQKYYFRLRDLRLESGVKNSFIFFEGQEYAVGAYSFDRGFAREDPLFIQNFPDFSEGDSYYGDPYFEKIVEYYVMPNSIGGDQYGIFNGNESDKAKCTVLEINTIRTDRSNTLEWVDNDDETKHTTIYLPSINGNQIVKIWCDLSNENVDRSFTYTVVDWDETVEVNVPDFE